MKINVPIYISTNDKHLICLKVFIDLFKKFWPNQSLNILGYTKPEEEFGDLVNFHSMGKQGTLKEWSTDLRNFFLNTKTSKISTHRARYRRRRRGSCSVGAPCDRD